jgi:hypothetical protein
MPNADALLRALEAGPIKAAAPASATSASVSRAHR